MNKKAVLILPVLSFLASGCASVMSGTDQEITFDSNPSGAECTLTRHDEVLATVTTSEKIRVKKLKYDIYVSCTMEGFHTSTAHVNSGTQGSVFGNIILGGGIGWAIDSASGADNKYPEVVTVTMVPLSQAAPAPVQDDSKAKKAEGNAAEPEAPQAEEPVDVEERSEEAAMPEEGEVKAPEPEAREVEPPETTEPEEATENPEPVSTE